MTRILIAGLGSIGQRHARNLRALFGDGADILAYRAVGQQGIITAAMTLDPSSTVEARYGIRSFDRLDEALVCDPEAVLVCNPTSRHMEVALAAARHGCHLLIEKPLAATLEGCDALLGAVARAGIVATVGYQMRFHPALLRLRELLCRKAIGRVRSVRAEMAEYLPDAHPYEDYRTSYAARADLGGGVILCYSHEIDYVLWLFGPARRVSATGGRLGDLEIDVEDTAHITLECERQGHAVPVDVHVTFLQRPSSRTCEVIGEQGAIRIDFIQSTLTLTDGAGSSERHTFDGFERNHLFLDELRAFVAATQGDRSRVAPLGDGVNALRVALAAKTSLATGRPVELT